MENISCNSEATTLRPCLSSRQWIKKFGKSSNTWTFKCLVLTGNEVADFIKLAQHFLKAI